MIKAICKKNNFLLGLIFLATHIITQNLFAGIPTIKEFVGGPLINLVEDKAKVQLAKNKLVDQSFTVKTASGEQLKVELGKDFYIIIFPESSIKVEGYYTSKTDFHIKALTFFSGRFYIKNGSSLPEDLTVIYQSDFFIWKNTEDKNQREFFLELNPTIAQVRFCAGAQGIAASIWDHETVKNLKFQEGASFQGVLKKGVLEFDLLLENRKVPKGEWQESFTCDFKQILKEMNELETLEAVKRKKAEQNAKLAEKKRKLEYEKSVCHEPNAQFNECLWKRENKTCVRYRCDGQGQWQDRQVLPKNQSFRCRTKPTVSKCDY